jgi:hypothetical protein
MPRARAEGQGRDEPVGKAGRLERTVDDLGDRRLREESDGQVGDRDADLRTGELGGQRAKGLLDALRTGVTVGGGPVDLTAVDGQEGELGSHEDTACCDQQQGCPEQDPFGHELSPRARSESTGL